MKKLQKKYSIAAFIDILGYKDLIQNEAIEREIELFNDLRNTIDLALASTVQMTKTLLLYFDKKNDTSNKISNKLKVKQFSDNIYFSFDYEEDNEEDFLLGFYIISNISLVYQRLMLGKGYFVRGGIAMGLNMVDKNFIFSTALIDAVETEKDTVFPRVTLHKKIKEKILSIENEQFKDLLQEMFVYDWADNLFLNPFNHSSRDIKALSKISDEEIEEIEQTITSTQKKIINKLNKNFSFVLDDKQFNSISRKHISKKIKRFKGRNQSVYEKFLWIRNFLNWVDNKQSDLIFRYF